MKEVYCKDCGQKLTGEGKICPNCGSDKRHIELELADKIELHDQNKRKVKRKGIRKPIIEFKSGDDLHRKSGKWYYREMYIDRENNVYKEIVMDNEEIIHECEEPLSEHKGHGSAKSRRKSKNED